MTNKILQARCFITMSTFYLNPYWYGFFINRVKYSSMIICKISFCCFFFCENKTENWKRKFIVKRKMNRSAFDKKTNSKLQFNPDISPHTLACFVFFSNLLHWKVCSLHKILHFSGRIYDATSVFIFYKLHEGLCQHLSLNLKWTLLVSRYR